MSALLRTDRKQHCLYCRFLLNTERHMSNKLLLILLLLVSSFSVVAKQQEVPLNLFKWAKAGFGVTFPQTYVIHKRDGVRYGRLGFGSDTEYLQSWQQQTIDGAMNVDALKQQFPEFHAQLEGLWKDHEQVIFSVEIDSALAPCGACQKQDELLKQQNYFELPYLKVSLTKS